MNIIKQPPKLAPYSFLSLGAIGMVYKIDEEIVLKIPRKARSDAFSREIKMFDLFEKYTPCPIIVQSFLRIPEGNFMAFLGGGTLDQRLRAHQSIELAHAAAWLEALGCVHADIRPPNLLLDGDDRLKLADFDCAARINSPSEGSAPPWARLLNVEARGNESSFGLYGARTEQFTIGSVIYLMTRGYEPYENEDPDLNIVDLFRRMVFPPLGNDLLDQIIDRCWKGHFEYLKDLVDETKSLSGGKYPEPMLLTAQQCLERQKVSNVG